MAEYVLVVDNLLSGINAHLEGKAKKVTDKISLDFVNPCFIFLFNCMDNMDFLMSEATCKLVVMVSYQLVRDVKSMSLEFIFFFMVFKLYI